LTKGFWRGDDKSPKHFRDLIQFILSVTIMEKSCFVQLFEGSSDGFFVLAGPKGPTDPLVLNDGRQLRLSITLMFEPHEDEIRLKVFESSFQYQTKSGNEIFRYDYLRNPKTHHPACHLQIHAKLDERSVHKHLQKVHFPTGRIPLEAVIRLLAEEFQIHCHAPKKVWRAVLAESERLFQEIAHQPLSGPAS
jgi:hypothetical protein